MLAADWDLATDSDLVAEFEKASDLEMSSVLDSQPDLELADEVDYHQIELQADSDCDLVVYEYVLLKHLCHLGK